MKREADRGGRVNGGKVEARRREAAAAGREGDDTLRGEKERKTIGPVWKRDRLERREHGPRGAAARVRGEGRHTERRTGKGRERERDRTGNPRAIGCPTQSSSVCQSVIYGCKFDSSLALTSLGFRRGPRASAGPTVRPRLCGSLYSRRTSRYLRTRSSAIVRTGIYVCQLIGIPANTLPPAVRLSSIERCVLAARGARPWLESAAHDGNGRKEEKVRAGGAY